MLSSHSGCLALWSAHLCLRQPWAEFCALKSLGRGFREWRGTRKRERATRGQN